MATVITGVLAQDWGITVSQTIAVSGNYIIPKGSWILFNDAAGLASLQVQSNETTPTWTNVRTNTQGIGGFVRSDGVNVRILNTSGAATVAIKLQQAKFEP